MRLHFPFHSTQVAGESNIVAAGCSVTWEQQFPCCVVWVVSSPWGPQWGFPFNSECFQLKVCEEEPWRSMRNVYSSLLAQNLANECLKAGPYFLGSSLKQLHVRVGLSHHLVYWCEVFVLLRHFWNSLSLITILTATEHFLPDLTFILYLKASQCIPSTNGSC